MGCRGKEVTEDPPAAKTRAKRTAPSDESSPASSRVGLTLGSPDDSQASAAASSPVLMQIPKKKSKSALVAIEPEEGTKTARGASACHHHGAAACTVSNTDTVHLMSPEHNTDFVEMSKGQPV